jgi:hypothetical protein
MPLSDVGFLSLHHTLLVSSFTSFFASQNHIPYSVIEFTHSNPSSHTFVGVKTLYTFRTATHPPSAPTTNIMHLFNTILFCSALVAAAPRVLSNTNSINQLTRRTALLNETLPRMSNDEAKAFVGKECWADGRVKWPVNDLPPPSVNKDSQQLSVFDSPATTPGSLTVHNYCNYDIHYRHEGQDNVLHANGVLSAGTSYIAPVSGLGQVWKGSKTADMGKVVLAEYSVQANNDIWYNLSLVKCLGVGKDGQYTTDTSACAGHEAGLQFGNQGFKSFQCAPGLWCDDQAYLYDVSHLHLR